MIGGCDPMINGRIWRTMRKLAVKIATQSALKLNPRSPVCTQSVRIPRRTAGLLQLGCSNSSKGVENSPTRTECSAQRRVLSTERMKSAWKLRAQKRKTVPVAIRSAIGWKLNYTVQVYHGPKWRQECRHLQRTEVST